MNLHEYQAKKLLADYGVPIPKGRVASSPEEAVTIKNEITGTAIIKAQIHSGGRGKSGGVKIISTSKDTFDSAKTILGSNLITYQTGPKGMPVNKVLVEEATNIDKEIYLSVFIDNDLGVPIVITSTQGGVEVEETARKSPEKIFKTICSPLVGLSPYKLRDIAMSLSIPRSEISHMKKIVSAIYKLFIEKDCTLIEINPLVITLDKKIVAVDAKINIDDDALFRHPDIQELNDPSQLEILEKRASDFDLSYVKLEGGKIGCMVNGAGLAMATMDITKWAGENPANFLDIGGSASETKIEEAFKIINDDPDVKIILVNLFAGIARADVVANGIVKAGEETQSKTPIVVTMRGTNSEQGLSILKNSNLDITPVADLDSAAKILKNKLSNTE